MAVEKLKSFAERATGLDQHEAPLVEAIGKYLADDVASFTMPAHKQGRALDPDTLDSLGRDSYRHDIGLLNGLDDIHESLELQDRAEKLASELIGADECFFLVNGSTLSVQCAITAVAGPGEKLIVARNGHKSIFSGLIVGGIEPVFVDPGFDDQLDLSHPVEPETVRQALAEHPDARGVVVVSPSYYGTATDLEAIADACHAHGVPLIADDAWGAHFPFHPELPPGSIASGSDIAIGSFHKSLTGLQQASILSLQGHLVDPTLVNYRIGLVETSSVSSLILASMDAARRTFALRGEELLERTLELARRARSVINEIPRLRVMGREVLGRPGAHYLDETKLVIDLHALGINGYDACDWLRTEQKLTVELADHRRVLALITIGDNDETIQRLIDALAALAHEHPNAHAGPPDLPPSSQLRTELVMPPRDAYFAPGEHIPIEESSGRIAAEKVTPYPPGVPVLVPGELITKPIIEYLRKGVEIGMNVTDVADSDLETIRVVAA